MTLQLAHARFSAKSYPPRRRPNEESRPREYLTPAEVRQLADAAKRVGRHGFRDKVLILTIYRHGFRVAEVTDLEWPRIHFDRLSTMHVKRVKNGIPSQHPLGKEEVRQLRQLHRSNGESRFVFHSERGGPMSERTVHAIVQRAGREAGFQFDVHPHMLRHARGFKLANEGQDTRAIQAFLGHRRIESTTIYTALDAGRFDGFTAD